MTSPGEQAIETNVVAHARRIGWLVFKATFRRGLPDRLFIKDGRVVFVEFKTAKGRVSALQQRTMRLLQQQGIECHVIRSPLEGQALFR